MVGYGSALRMARRPGWENAYLDYEALKLILTQIEAIYEEAISNREFGSSENLFELYEHQSHDEADDATLNGADTDAAADEWNEYISWGAGSNKESLPLLNHQSKSNANGFNKVDASGPVNAAGLIRVHEFSSLVYGGESSDNDNVNISDSYSRESRRKKRGNGKSKRSKSKKERKESLYLKRAHKQARQLAERFLGLLQSEVEKVSLFFLSRQGELADTVGALRFGDATQLSDGNTSSSGLWNNAFHSHPSASSSSEDENIHLSFDSTEERDSIRLSNRHSTSSRKSSRTQRASNRRRDFGYSKVQRPMFRRSSFIVEDDLMLSTGVDESDAFTTVGIELLHLLRFICVNAMGVRKILKKYDKLLLNCMLGGAYKIANGNLSKQNRLVGTADAHLQSLANSMAIEAISESLRSALVEYKLEAKRAGELRRKKVGASCGFKSFEPSSRASFHFLSSENHVRSASDRSSSFDFPVVKPLSASEFDDEEESSVGSCTNLSLLRLEYTINAIALLRDAAKVMNTPFDVFLHRSALYIAGRNLGGLNGSSREALDLLLPFNPDNIMQYHISDFFGRGVNKGFAGFDLSEAGFSIDATAKSEQHADEIHFPTQLLNLASVFLYSMNYYIVAPTASDYATILGYHPSMAGTLIGVSSISAMFSTLLYSFMPLLSSYKLSLVCSSILPIIGNLLYSYAITANSFWVAICGRILVGFGSAEAVNRQMIAYSVPVKYIAGVSAAFVVASALGEYIMLLAYIFFQTGHFSFKRRLRNMFKHPLINYALAGMSTGPCFAAILDASTGRDINVVINILGGIVIDNVTSPGIFMATLWLLQLLSLLFFFKEPDTERGGAKVNRDVDCKDQHEIKSLPRSASDVHVDLKETYAPLEKPTHNFSPYSPLCSAKELEPHRKKSRSIASKLSRVWKIVTHNITLPVTLALFAFIEFTDEIIISSCALVTGECFKWNAVYAGFMVATLGLLGLPANIFVEYLSRTYDERRIMQHSLVFTGISLFALLNFEPVASVVMAVVPNAFPFLGNRDQTTSQSEFPPYDWSIGQYQYVFAVSLSFMGTMFLESVVISMMSKAAPAKLNRSFLNCGLLATLFGSLGRIFGDILITCVEWIGWDYVNTLYIPVIFGCASGYYIVKRHYFNLLC